MSKYILQYARYVTGLSEDLILNMHNVIPAAKEWLLYAWSDRSCRLGLLRLTYKWNDSHLHSIHIPESENGFWAANYPPTADIILHLFFSCLLAWENNSLIHESFFSFSQQVEQKKLTSSPIHTFEVDEGIFLLCYCILRGDFLAGRIQQSVFPAIAGGTNRSD